MTIKKWLALCLVLGLALVLGLSTAGCGGDDEAKTPAPQPKAEPAPAPKAEPAPATSGGGSVNIAEDPEEPQEALASFKIKDGAGNTVLKVKQMREGRWTVRAGDRKWALEADGTDVWKFERPDGTKLKAKKDGDKLKLKRDDGSVVVEVKFYDDKLKINHEGSGEYQFKYREDKVKVELDGRDIGKVKHYPDKGKIKAKDASESEVAECKGVDRVSAVLAPMLMESSVPEETRYFLVALLFTLNK